MPAYDYRCRECEAIFEVTRSIKDTAPQVCPACGSEAKRLFTPVGIHFKGTGFHNTDYRKKSALPPTEKTEKAEK
ncbi:MAG: FmdB family zinc ribbon protein, partial [Coriobacteriia bacterium]